MWILADEDCRARPDVAGAGAALERRRLVKSTYAQLEELRDQILASSQMQIMELAALVQLRDSQVRRCRDA